MDIKNLMIGDWVYNKHHGKNIRLTQYDFFTHTHNEFGEQELAPFAKPTFGRDLEPIPLTKEILEKNGFKYKEGETGMYGVTTAPHYICDGVPFEVFCDGEPFAIWFKEPINIKYTHQLQHALRLCGIKKEIEL